jgi:hypothetical protein
VICEFSLQENLLIAIYDLPLLLSTFASVAGSPLSTEEANQELEHLGFLLKPEVSCRSFF